MSFESIPRFIEKHFLLIAIALTVLALIFPGYFIPFGPKIPILLGIIMFGMGLTLEFSDFQGVLRKTRLVFLGTLLQFTVMPVLAVLISVLFHLPSEWMIGMVIVGSCPGGTASNVICYLARANLALSIVLTFVSTMLAPVVTPALIFLILHKTVQVDFISMMKMVFWIIAIPVTGGIMIRHFFKRNLEPVIRIFPSISILSIALVIAAIMALNRGMILAFPVAVTAAVILHNLGGLSAGYFISKFFHCEEADSRTLAIEVGMQNSGLGVALANQFFGAASALPGAIFSLWHNVSGILLAKFWAGRNGEALLKQNVGE